jgi:hypothetical protein
LEDGFTASLRPYSGLHEKNFHLIMEALLVVGERIHREPQVDRELVKAVWSTEIYLGYSGGSLHGGSTGKDSSSDSGHRGGSVVYIALEAHRRKSKRRFGD